MKFNERLKELRLSNNISQVQLAKDIGVSRTMVQIYESGEKEPTLSKLIIISNFFNVSIDYLCGLTDNPKINF